MKKELELNHPLPTGPNAEAAGRAAMPRTLAQAFADSVERFAERAAIKPQDGQAITYAQLGRQVRTALSVLRQLGIMAGDRIAICLPNGPEWAYLTYASALIGACVVPVNLRYREEELRYALYGSDAKAIFTTTQFLSNPILDRLRSIAGGAFCAHPARPITALPSLQHIVMMDNASEVAVSSYADLAAHAPPIDTPFAELAAERSGPEPMWLFWTSGTTSRPKAALLPQSTIEIVWEWTTLAGYLPEDRVLTSRPLFYIAGHFWSLLGPMIKGACSVIASRYTPEEFVHLCASEKVTILSGNPMMFKRLIQDDAFDPSAFEHVRLGYFGGSTLPLDEMRRIQEAIGIESMIQTYGMTELGGFIMSTLPNDSLETACASCGYPFTKIELKLVSPDTGEEVPDGQAGMLLTKGEKLIRYVNLPESERAKLYDEDGWYRTGDLLRKLPDGRYQLVGRLKDLIKVGGENISAGEIEDALMKNPEVSLAAVVARSDNDRGEVPVAFVELGAASGTSMSELKAWCKSSMAPYKVPAEFYEMRPSDWPMTSTGKIAKHELSARLATLPAPRPGA